MAARTKKKADEPKPEVTEEQDRAAAELASDKAEAAAAPEADPAEATMEAAIIPGFDPKHLTGQLGDFLLEQCKHARHLKPYDKLDEFEQKRLIDYCYDTARGAVIGAAHAIAGKGFQSAPMRIDNWQVKDELKIVLTGNINDDLALSLIHNRGMLVQLVFADADEFAGKMTAKPQPNQPPLIEAADGLDPDDGEDEAEGDEIVDEETGEITQAPVVEQPPPADQTATRGA